MLVSHPGAMNGFIIETTGDGATGRQQKAARWIGIATSAADMIAQLPGHSPSVVDRGPEVLKLARNFGLSDGEFTRYYD